MRLGKISSRFRLFGHQIGCSWGTAPSLTVWEKELLKEREEFNVDALDVSSMLLLLEWNGIIYMHDFGKKK